MNTYRCETEKEYVLLQKNNIVDFSFGVIYMDDVVTYSSEVSITIYEDENLLKDAIYNITGDLEYYDRVLNSDIPRTIDLF